MEHLTQDDLALIVEAINFYREKNPNLTEKEDTQLLSISVEISLEIDKKEEEEEG